MIALNRRTKIFMCKEATDMRSSYDSLFSRVKTILEKDPFSGHLFLFVNKVRTSCKCLYYDGTGLVIISKRLERGNFSRVNPMYGKEVVLTDFVEKASEKIKEEILESKVVNADETPHRMLEGADKSSWYLWGFSTPTASYFEIRDTRSGDVASELLTKSKCEYLMSDVYSGYAKAVRETNEERKKLELPSILNVYCNAHARRKFKESEDNFEELVQFFIEQYSKIYRLEKFGKGKPPNRVLRARGFMAPLFENMRTRAIETLGGYSTKSSIGKAMNYFLKNYEELTRFISNVNLPADNNRQEALLRNPVVGRKTWYGTHSVRGAKTAAIMHTLVESCKINGVNPRKYFPKLIQNIHEGKKIFTPF